MTAPEVDYYRVNMSQVINDSPDDSPLPMRLPAAAKNGEGELMATGYVSFKIAAPGTVTKQLDAADRDPLLAGDIVGDDIVGYTFTATSSGQTKLKDFVRYNRTEKTFTTISDVSSDSRTVLDMAYDQLHNKMYALTVASGAVNTSLSQVDLATGAITFLTNFDLRLYSMACDGAGNLFFVERSNGRLWVIEHGDTSYTPVRIGGSGKGALMISSMAFDRTTNKLYWARTGLDDTGEKNECMLVEINPLNGTQFEKGTISRSGKSTELLTFVIPEPAYPEGSPAMPTDLKVTPQAKGATAADLSWINPSGNLDKILVYVDNNLKQTLTDVTPGAKMNLSLKGIAHGYHYFRVIGVNSVGEGQPADYFVWIGTDVPFAPTNLLVKREIDGSASLSWEAPTASIHGAYLPETIKYRITRRSADGNDTILVKVHNGLTYTDNVDKGMTYAYTVQALSNSFGDAVTSDFKYVGEAKEVPLMNYFNDSAELNDYEIEDLNGDRMGWSYTVYGGNGYLTCMSFSNSSSDDKLITAPVKLKKDTEYLLSFKTRTGNGVYGPRWLNVTMKKTGSLTPDSIFNEKLMTDTTEVRHIPLRVTQDGEYTFTFHDYSQPSRSSLTLDDIFIRENNFGKLTGRVTDKKGNPVAGAIIDLSEPYYRRITDDDGRYAIDYIPASPITLRASKYHYHDTTTETFTVSSGENRVLDIVLDRCPHYKLSGYIIDDNDSRVPGVEVSIRCNGEITRTTTDSEGYFLFPDVINLNHGIEFAKPKYRYARGAINVKSDTTLTVLIHPGHLDPSAPETQVDDKGIVTVSWGDPREVFRRDCGVQEKQTGTAGGNKYSIAGTVWRVPARINAISWMNSAYAGPHKTMNLWLFDINEDGTPKSEPLYCAMDVPTNGDLNWTTYQLPEPVDCPNGFLVGVSYSYGMSSLAMDTGSDEDWPFIDGVNFTNKDYRSDKWNCCDQFYLYRNFMIRPEGEPLDPAYTPFAYRYKLWRLTDSKSSADPSRWELLTDTDGENIHRYTEDFAALPADKYRYAIAIKYPDGTETSPVLSEIVNDYTGVGAAASDQVSIVVNGLEITISAPASSCAIKLYDLSGRCVASANGHLVKSFDAPGAVLVSVSSGNENVIRKIYLK